MKEIYFGFDDWEDVKRSFECDEEEPEEVIFAWLEGEGYAESATVIYRNKDKYFLVESSHCSCYGFEDQWEPEDYNLHEFKEMIKRREFYAYNDSEKSIIEALKKHIEEI